MSAFDFTARALALRAARQVTEDGSALLNGAAGDGVTDDAPALNALVARAGEVRLPPARYRIGASIRVPSNAHLKMASGARLLPATANMTMVDIRGAKPDTWEALTANLAKGSRIWTHGSTAYEVGQWVEFRSDAPVPGPNSNGSKIACVRRITGKSGVGPCTYTLSKPVLDDFEVAENAIVGVATVVENVVLENVTLNDEDYSIHIGFGINLEYCAHVRIVNPTIIGSKARNGADVVSWDGIKVNHGCTDIVIENPVLKHLGWYGVDVAAGAEQVRVLGGHAEDCRHAVSVVYAPHGEPSDLLVQGMTAMATTLSGFDTHDTGRDILFRDCVSIGAGDDGFQFRASNVRAVGCTARESKFDGFSDAGGASGSLLIGCKAIANGRMGYNFAGHAELNECDGLDHSQTGTGGGYALMLRGGGTVRGGRFTGNVAVLRIYDAPLLVHGIHAPADAKQTQFASAVTASGGRYNLVTLRNNYLPGYGNKLFMRQLAARPPGDLPPISAGNRLTDGSEGTEWVGEATLVGGTATVSTTAVRRLTSASWLEDLVSRVDLRRVSPGGTIGDIYVESVSDGAGFVIRSTSSTDTSRVKWSVEL